MTLQHPCADSSPHPEITKLEFQIKVSHWTQEPSSEFLLVAPGIRQSASRRTRRLDPAKPGEMSQVSGGEVELVDVGGDRLIESVEVAA